ncbi:hypothetical protein Tco_0923243 [Tanacetum coccineum]|uniref:Uncharacterized protein n=1 Tax=Tanacetum coccineum TaxID=301880 RepID=A0ABQ5D1F3_9ASTR
MSKSDMEHLVVKKPNLKVLFRDVSCDFAFCGIHVECGRMLSDRGLRAFVTLAAIAVIPNVSRTPSFMIILVAPAVVGHGIKHNAILKDFHSVCSSVEAIYASRLSATTRLFTTGLSSTTRLSPRRYPPLAILLASEVNAQKQHLATEMETL